MVTFDIAFSKLELFILILMRIASFVFAAPFFNVAGTPRKVKVGFSVFFSVLIYNLYPDMQYQYDGVIGYAVLVLKEVVVGVFLGVVCSFCVQIIMFAGKIIDMEIGLAMAQVFDPTMKTQVGLMGNFYYYLLMLLLIISGLYQYLISAIVETYNAIPIGMVKYSTTLYTDIISFMADYFIIGFRIALPVFSSILLVNCVLAILARVAPQMNMFVVGLQLKIFAGIFIIFFTISMLPAVSNVIMEKIQYMFAVLVRGMS